MVVVMSVLTRSRLLRTSSAVLNAAAAPLTFISVTLALGLMKNEKRGRSAVESRTLSASDASERLTNRNLACTSTFNSAGTTRALISYFLISNSCARPAEEKRTTNTRQTRSLFIGIIDQFFRNDSVLFELT